MAVFVQIAERLGDDALKDVDGAFHILKPSQYHHAQEFLETKYGKESVEKAIISAAFKSNFGFRLSALEESVSQLEKTPDLLSNLDKQSLEEGTARIAEFTPMLSELGIKTLEDLRKYRTLLDSLGKHLGKKDQLEAYSDEIAQAFFAVRMIASDTENKFANVESAYHQIDPAELAPFRRSLARCLGYVLDLKEVPVLWKVVSRIGVAKEVRGLIKEIKRKREED